MTEIFRHTTFIQQEIHRLRILGFYPNDSKWKFFTYLWTIVVYLITFAQMWTVIALTIHSPDLTVISEIFLFSMTQVSFVNKLVSFHLKLDNAAELERMLSRNVFTRVTPAELGVMKAEFRKCQGVLNVFIVLCFGVVVFYTVFPAIDQGQPGKKNYPFPGEFPFNPDDYYVWIYCGQILTVASSAWTNSAIDCLFQKHVTMATVFFQILCERLRNAMGKTNEPNDSISRKIKKCVIYYNATTEYVSMIQRTFSYGILLQFLCSVIIICLTVFQVSLVVEYSSTKFVLMIIYLLCMLFQVALYCWYGHMLMEKSNEITAACYAITWNDMSVHNQKLLITVMERAKRPVELNASGVFKLNLSTMVTILRTSYSYFAVLQQIYRK